MPFITLIKEHLYVKKNIGNAIYRNSGYRY